MSGIFQWTDIRSMDSQQPEGVAAPKRDVPRSYEMHLRFLEENVAKALLIHEALWELMRDKLQLTEQQLFDKLYEIDMRDGIIDGKNQRSVVECPKCKRKVAPKHATCLYCGQIIDNSVFQLSR
jgi:hypothetical protein